VELRVINSGYLGTYGLSSAKSLPHVERLRLSVEGDNFKIVAPGEAVIDIGHLDGWGTGLHHGISIFFPWTRGNVHEKNVTLVVQGTGPLRLKVGSCRVGWQTKVVAID
jgi:hypothetical protein